MPHRHVLFVCHDAGGNVPPMIALVEALILKGHRVSVLGQPSVRRRAMRAGAGFFSFSSIGDYRRDAMLEDQPDIAIAVLAGRSVGDDLITLVQDHDIDLVVVDANLAGGLAAAETLDQPSVVLLHSMYATFVDTWLDGIWPYVCGAINDTRNSYHLDSAAGWPDLFARHDRLLAVVPADFDAPTDTAPAAMRHFGFLVPRPSGAARSAAFPPGPEPAVLVGLSTTHNDQQDALLAAIVEALGALPVRALITTNGPTDAGRQHHHPNITITDYVSHTSLLDQTDVVVTHGGLGTVAAALSSAVPLVCVPLGRDQPLNAARVAEWGAGLTVDHRSTNDLRGAIQEVLGNPNFRAAAASIAHASRLAGGPTGAASDIEALID